MEVTRNGVLGCTVTNHAALVLPTENDHVPTPAQSMEAKIVLDHRLNLINATRMPAVVSIVWSVIFT